jgi:hypothetical protein
MGKAIQRSCLWFALLSALLVAFTALAQSSPSQAASQIGREVAIPAHLQDGDEFNIPLAQLIDYGKRLFSAKFTVQEGAGRPMSKGTGAPISDPTSPLLFPRNFDRVSSPEANACSGCHNAPSVGAGGDRVTEVFVLAQRFDHLVIGSYTSAKVPFHLTGEPGELKLGWDTGCSVAAVHQNCAKRAVSPAPIPYPVNANWGLRIQRAKRDHPLQDVRFSFALSTDLVRRLLAREDGLHLRGAGRAEMGLIIIPITWITRLTPGLLGGDFDLRGGIAYGVLGWREEVDAHSSYDSNLSRHFPGGCCRRPPNYHWESFRLCG